MQSICPLGFNLILQNYQKGERAIFSLIINQETKNQEDIEQ
ncbi:hypothetical protein pb186bvf_004437 [Paramecium bursaria]